MQNKQRYARIFVQLFSEMRLKYTRVYDII